jgi:hypothetical protein
MLRDDALHARIVLDEEDACRPGTGAPAVAPVQTGFDHGHLWFGAACCAGTISTRRLGEWESLSDCEDIIARGLLARFPKVQLQHVVTDRAVDLIEERIDLTLRVRHELTTDASLTMRSLEHSLWIFVANPQTESQLGADITELASVGTLGTKTDDAGEVTGHSSGTTGRHMCCATSLG